MLVKLDHLPSRAENQKEMKPPPSDDKEILQPAGILRVTLFFLPKK